MPVTFNEICIFPGLPQRYPHCAVYKCALVYQKTVYAVNVTNAQHLSVDNTYTLSRSAMKFCNYFLYQCIKLGWDVQLNTNTVIDNHTLQLADQAKYTISVGQFILTNLNIQKRLPACFPLCLPITGAWNATLINVWETCEGSVHFLVLSKDLLDLYLCKSKSYLQQLLHNQWVIRFRFRLEYNLIWIWRVYFYDFFTKIQPYL